VTYRRIKQHFAWMGMKKQINSSRQVVPSVSRLNLTEQNTQVCCSAYLSQFQLGKWLLWISLRAYHALVGWMWYLLLTSFPSTVTFYPLATLLQPLLLQNCSSLRYTDCMVCLWL
jgi:hypothetical protein